MPLFISGDTLKGTVERLSNSLAHSTLADYLIFKRALKVTQEKEPKTKQVTTGLGSSTFQQAIAEFTACQSSGNDQWKGQPHFSPFGASRDKGRGYKSAKYPSNGPSDTVSRWQSRAGSPLKLVGGTSPKAYQFDARKKEELRDFLIKGGANQEDLKNLPHIGDLAIWWYRFTDLHNRFGKKTPDLNQLSKGAIEDLDLSKEEITAFFISKGNEEQIESTLTFAETVASPDAYLPAGPGADEDDSTTKKAPRKDNEPATPIDGDLGNLNEALEALGFAFEPWQVAAYVSAVRTKPFVILAGISGTGKTKLPRLIAQITGAEVDCVPVRPDWTDSSELLGYERLDGSFCPGHLLRIARRAIENPKKQFFLLLDEMNIARVEYYFAEVLSHIEERWFRDGLVQSAPLMPNAADPEWGKITFPPNLAIVGSVNMDETTHGFSRKVLDRSFVIEFSDIDLTRITQSTGEAPPPINWSSEIWRQRYLSLPQHPNVADNVVKDVISALVAINEILVPAQLQVGYRVRDEIALFCLNAKEAVSHFGYSDMGTVDPLDLAVSMKILPRIQGGGEEVSAVIQALLKWADPSRYLSEGSEAKGKVHRSYPICAERLEIMQQRLSGTGFTSFWL